LLAALEAELDAPVDVFTEAGLRPALRERVLRDAVPV
jgi:predicted nucleotidyltransferase